jgi:hypothetical protein
MKFLGVSGVFDYAGLNRSSRYRACSCCLPRITRASASGLTVFGAEYPPHLSSVYASLCTSRYPAQDSRPSGSLFLSRKALSSSASCRFSPAHRNGLIAQLTWLRVCRRSERAVRVGAFATMLSLVSFTNAVQKGTAIYGVISNTVPWPAAPPLLAVEYRFPAASRIKPA